MQSTCFARSQQSIALSTLFVYRALVCTISLFCRGAELKPVFPGTEGEAAFRDLEIYYRTAKEPEYRGALDGLKSPQVATALKSGRYLASLFQQSSADEQNGRATWRSVPYWGGGAESPAREFRRALAKQFGESASGPAAFLAMEWALTHEELADILAEVAGVLPRIKSPEADAFVGKLLSPPHPNGRVLVVAVREAARRKLHRLEPTVRDLCYHHRTAVREAAREAAAALEIRGIPPFKPTDALSPWLTVQAQRFSEMVVTAIPTNATWCELAVTNLASRTGRESMVTRFSGWLISETQEDLKVIDWFGNERVLLRSQSSIAPLALAEQASRLSDLERQSEEKKDRSLREHLSREGGLTAQFEPRFVDIPSALVGSWCYQRGENEGCAALWLPLLDKAADDRWFTFAVRDLLGHNYFQAMLVEFSYERDYDRAQRFATHLSKPVFDGYCYQEIALRLSAQLARRGEDFKTLTLPTPTDWAGLRKTMTRGEQIEFLVKCLRLLNCIQWGQPGGVDYHDEQYSLPTRRLARTEREKFVVINPYNELQHLKLAVAELVPLAPALKDENFIPTFSYWRDFHPSRTVHQVNWLVADVINAVAKRALADVEGWDHLPPGDKDEEVAKVIRWCRANSGKSEAELLLESIAQADRWYFLEKAAGEAVRLKTLDSVPALLAREKDFPDRRSDIAELAFYSGSPEAQSRAREWIQDTNLEVRFWGTLILLKHDPGSPSKSLSLLKTDLESTDGVDLYTRAVEPLLELNDEKAAELACGILERPKFIYDWNARAITRFLFLAKRKEVLDWLLKGMDDLSHAGATSGEWQQKRISRDQVRGDYVAKFFEDWRTDGWTYPTLAPDDERAKVRQELKAWLRRQFDLLLRGERSEIKPKDRSLQFSRWQIDAP